MSALACHTHVQPDLIRYITTFTITGQVGVGLFLECRVSGNFKGQCQIKNLDSVGCREKPLYYGC